MTSPTHGPAARVRPATLLGRVAQATGRTSLVTRPPTGLRAEPTGERPPPRVLAGSVAALGVALAVNSLLGPLGVDALVYRYGPSMTNQAVGLDLVSLVVAAPLAGVAALLVRRNHRAGPVLALAPALFAAYMMPQYVVGPDYLGLAGNNERFAPAHIAIFVLAVAVAVLAWRTIDPSGLPPDSRRSDRRRAGVLLGVAAFIGLGRQLPAVAGVIGDRTSSAAYVDNPTAFWLVVFLDLGVVVPAAAAAAAGLWWGAAWGRVAAYAVIGWFSLVPVSVLAMNVMMRINGDPLATTADTLAFGAAAIVLTAGAAWLYRPLFVRT